MSKSNEDKYYKARINFRLSLLIEEVIRLN